MPERFDSTPPAPEAARPPERPRRPESIPPPPSSRESVERAFQNEAVFGADRERVSAVLREIQLSERCPDCFPLRTGEMDALVRVIQAREQLNALDDGDLARTVRAQLDLIVGLRERAPSNGARKP